MKKVHLEKIIARAKRYIFGDLLGQNSAKRIGDGYDFAQISAYTYGSSIRRIDAFSSAKKNELHVRDFYESKDVNIHVVICASGSLEFGTKEIKKDSIASIVAMLGFSAIADSENFSFSIFSEQLDYSFRAKKSKNYVKKALEELLSRDYKGSQISYKNLSSYLLKQRRSLVFIIGDFFEFPKLATVAKKHDIVAIKVRDSFENEPKYTNYFDGVAVQSLQKQELFFDKKTLDEYKKALSKHDVAIGEYFKKYGIKQLEIISGEDMYKKVQNLARGFLVEELRDIKALVEIPDYSLYIFIAMVICFLIILFLLARKIKWKKRRKEIDFKLLAKQKLRALDLEDAKKSSYELTQALQTLDLEKEYEGLLKKLEKYKYKKEVQDFTAEEIEEIKSIRKAHGV